MGTLVDISGNLKNGTTSGQPMMTKMGMMFDGSNDSVSLGNIGNVKTIALRIKPSSTTCKILQGTAGGVLVHINAGTLTASDFATKYVDGVAGTTMAANLWQTVILVSATDVAMTAVTLALNTATYGKFEIADLRFYNRVLSLQEVKNYHNSFVKPYLVEDFSKEGADGVAKVPSGWTKTSGAFKVGEFQATKGNMISWLNTYNGTVISGTGAIFNYTGGVANNTLLISSAGIAVVGKRYRVRCVISSYTSGSAYITFRNFFGSGVFTMNGLGAFEVDFVFTGGTGTDGKVYIFTAPGNFVATISSCSIEEIPPLPTFKNGTKYLECVTAGVLSLPSKQAYGTFEFDWYVVTSNVPLIHFNTKPNILGNGYAVRINGNAAFGFYSVTSGAITFAFYTVNNYVVVNTWYRLKITRTLAGVFTVYIKGGAFGNNSWTLISTTAGGNPTTNNTYTELNYLALEIDAGDRIANITLYDGIIQ
jgi:hypothetical protein